MKLSEDYFQVINRRKNNLSARKMKFLPIILSIFLGLIALVTSAETAESEDVEGWRLRKNLNFYFPKTIAYSSKQFK